MSGKLWQVEIRKHGELVSDEATARAALEALNLVPDEATDDPARIGAGGELQAEDPENGVWLAELPSRYDEDLEAAARWGGHEALEQDDTYEVWVPLP